MTPNNKQSTMRDFYNSYLQYSFSVFPISEEGEMQIVDRKKYQSRIPTDSEVEYWLEECPHSNIGIITGKISDIIVVEVYNEAQLQRLTDLIGEDPFNYPTVTTPTGYNIYMKYPGYRSDCESAIIDGIDIHSDGSFVMAPPSIDEDNIAYSWSTTIEDAGGIPDVPEALLILLNGGNEAIEHMSKQQHY